MTCSRSPSQCAVVSVHPGLLASDLLLLTPASGCDASLEEPTQLLVNVVCLSVLPPSFFLLSPLLTECLLLAVYSSGCWGTVMNSKETLSVTECRVRLGCKRDR